MKKQYYLDELSKAGAIVSMITAVLSLVLSAFVYVMMKDLLSIFSISWLGNIYQYLLIINLVFAIPSFIFNLLVLKNGYKYHIPAIIFGFLGSNYIGPLLLIIGLINYKQQRTEA